MLFAFLFLQEAERGHQYERCTGGINTVGKTAHIILTGFWVSQR